MTVVDVRRRQLAEAYANNTGTAVAFIDESYFGPKFAAESTARHFYLVTAYVIPAEEMSAMRVEILDVVGGGYWHSTEANRTTEGQQRIRDFARYVGEGNEPIIVAVQQPIDDTDTDAELARAHCMETLLVSLARGEFCSQVSLAIYEERKFMSQRNADEQTIKRARASGNIPRTMRVMPSSPSYEKLLWLPDLVSFALYQQKSGQRQEFLAPFRERIQLVNVE